MRHPTRTCPQKARIYGYAYDYRTRRVMRTEPGPVTTHLVFDGGVSILEYTASAGTPTVEYVRGPDFGRPHTPESQKDHHTSHGHHHHSAGGGVGGLEYSIRDEAPSYNLYDSRGDVTTKTDSNGAVSYQSAYEAFGNQTATSGSTLDRQKASTKEQDPTGLLNEGFRYRDPSTGTFLSRDPLGFLAGPNMYTYVRQNPWTHFDPEGLDIHALHEFWAGMGDSFIGAGKGMAHAAMHPIDTGKALASGAAHAIAHPIATATAVAHATASEWQSGPRGMGHVMGNVLTALAPIPGASAAKVGSGIASKVGDVVASARGVKSLTGEAKFAAQGFNKAQAEHLAAPYTGEGHHFPITQAAAKNLGAPDAIKNHPLNVSKPEGMSQGDFYEHHFKVDPSFHGTKVPGGSQNWSGQALGMKKYGPVGRAWHGTSDAAKSAAGAAAGAAPAAGALVHAQPNKPPPPPPKQHQ